MTWRSIDCLPPGVWVQVKSLRGCVRLARSPVTRSVDIKPEDKFGPRRVRTFERSGTPLSAVAWRPAPVRL